MQANSSMFQWSALKADVVLGMTRAEREVTIVVIRKCSQLSTGPSRLRCPRLWLRTIAGKSTCGGSVALPWEAHPKGGNYDGV